MKHDCDIVRDLMPMCIDGTASDKAKAMVDEHVQECPPCDKVYAEMKGEAKIELPVQPAAPEFVTTVKKMKNRRKRRTWLTLLLGVMIAAVVAWLGFYGYYWYFVEHILLEEARLSLVKSTDGIGLIHASNVPKSAYMVIRLSKLEYPESAKGQCEAHVYLSATRYEARNDADDVYFVVGNVEDGRVLTNDEWGNEVPVYRMLLTRIDESGQVFYLAGEEELKVVSIRGAHLKSPERTYFHEDRTYQSVPFMTITPMPTYTPNPDGAQAYMMVQTSPTPTVRPLQEAGNWGPVQNTPTPTPSFTGTPD